MRRRIARPSLFVPLIAAMIALQSCAKTEPAPLPVASADMPANAVALTFGRCDSDANTCPGPAEPKSAGDATFQSVLLKCLQAQLGRPVYPLGDASIPPGFWLDASVEPIQADVQAGRTKIIFRLFHGVGKQLDGFMYTLPADVASYREVCRQYAEQARPRLQ